MDVGDDFAGDVAWLVQLGLPEAEAERIAYGDGTADDVRALSDAEIEVRLALLRRRRLRSSQP